ncbi:MAG TPA: hypothetical protein VKE22_08765 [Haliangiales bacterium]|nr:hypothetical protein [Haliangiales bacterium]
MKRLRAFPWLACAVLPFLAAWKPFTQVTNVCPSCKVPSAHVVVLKDGTTIPCEVVAQNDDFWVLKWHSEYRAAERSEVDHIDWRGTDPASLKLTDQIRDKDGLVYQGGIIEQNDRFFVIEGDGFRHTIWMPQILDVHKSGKKVKVGAGG